MPYAHHTFLNFIRRVFRHNKASLASAVESDVGTDKESPSTSYSHLADIPTCSSYSHGFFAQLECDSDLLRISAVTRAAPEWAKMLATDIDRDFVLSGICLGFPLVLDISEVSPADECNYKSALNCDTKPILDELFREELLTQKLAEVQDKPLRIQAIGAVPKKDSAVPRPITDCSRPFGDSLNSYISTEKFSFVSVEAATALCKPGSFMAIVDIKSAYRAIPILPQHRKLQGIRWQFTGDQLPRYLVDNFLCFGLSNAPVFSTEYRARSCACLIEQG